MTEAAVAVEGLHKAFGAVRAVDGMDFAVPAGQMLGLLGPSGCGKTTALRLIAGLERPDAGRVWLGGRLVAGPGVYVAPERRRVGMVPQDYALFPHLDVAANVAFGLSHTPDRAARVAALLALVGLEGLGRRWPHELSGGQQQRVALARALAPRPDVLLLDEPFSNLDAALRERVRAEVRAILREAGVTVVFVTHDREEALGLADLVAVVEAGRILQLAPPDVLYHWPASPAVAAAVGEAHLLPGEAADSVATCELGTVPLARPAWGPVCLLLRPEALDLCEDPAGPATVTERQFLGPTQLVTVRLLSGATLRARLATDHLLPVGARVAVRPRRPVLPFPGAAAARDGRATPAPMTSETAAPAPPR